MDRPAQRSVVARFPAFLERCTRGHAVLDHVAAQHAVPAYLLGLLNTAFLTAERWPVTEAMLRSANPYSTGSRLGGEHWAHLVDIGLAVPAGDGWAVTASGLAAVFELHCELRAEVGRRSAPPALVSVARASLGRIAELVPPTTKIRAIRRLWNVRPVAAVIVDLYRVVWELSVHRDECHRAAWETAGYTGPAVDALTQVWSGAGDMAELGTRLRTKRSEEGVRESVVALAERGDIERTGELVALTEQGRMTRDGIEERTDDAYFRHWPTGASLYTLSQSFHQLMRELR